MHFKTRRGASDGGTFSRLISAREKVMCLNHAIQLQETFFGSLPSIDVLILMAAQQRLKIKVHLALPLTANISIIGGVNVNV